jgi:hypothetical protein
VPCTQGLTRATALWSMLNGGWRRQLSQQQHVGARLRNPPELRTRPNISTDLMNEEAIEGAEAACRQPKPKVPSYIGTALSPGQSSGGPWKARQILQVASRAFVLMNFPRRFTRPCVAANQARQSCAPRVVQQFPPENSAAGARFRAHRPKYPWSAVRRSRKLHHCDVPPCKLRA